MNYYSLLLLGLLFALLVSPPPLVGATVTIHKFKGEDVDDGHVTSSTVQTGVHNSSRKTGKSRAL